MNPVIHHRASPGPGTQGLGNQVVGRMFSKLLFLKAPWLKANKGTLQVFTVFALAPTSPSE